MTAVSNASPLIHLVKIKRDHNSKVKVIDESGAFLINHDELASLSDEILLTVEDPDAL